MGNSIRRLKPINKIEEVQESQAEEKEAKPVDDKTRIKELELENAALLRSIQNYTQHGPMRMYYALNRKVNEMADVLNTTRLQALKLSDGSDKTYDRIKSICNDATDLSKTVMELRKVSGATDDESKDMRRSFDIDEFSKERV